jgi:hypothetical protein
MLESRKPSYQQFINFSTAGKYCGANNSKKKLAMAGLNVEILQVPYNNSDGDSLHEFLSQKIKTEILIGLQNSTVQKIIEWFAK